METGASVATAPQLQLFRRRNDIRSADWAAASAAAAAAAICVVHSQA